RPFAFRRSHALPPATRDGAAPRGTVSFRRATSGTGGAADAWHSLTIDMLQSASRALSHAQLVAIMQTDASGARRPNLGPTGLCVYALSEMYRRPSVGRPAT